MSHLTPGEFDELVEGSIGPRVTYVFEDVIESTGDGPLVDSDGPLVGAVDSLASTVDPLVDAVGPREPTAVSLEDFSKTLSGDHEVARTMQNLRSTAASALVLTYSPRGPLT